MRSNNTLKIIFMKPVKMMTSFLLMILLMMLLYGSSRGNTAKVDFHAYDESANYMAENDQFYCLIDNMRSTEVDHYADSLWLSIAYGLQPNLESVMWTSYYDDFATLAHKDILSQVNRTFLLTMNICDIGTGQRL